MQWLNSLIERGFRRKTKLVVVGQAQHSLLQKLVIACVFCFMIFLSYYFGLYHSSDAAFERDDLRSELKATQALVEQERLNAAKFQASLKLSEVSLERLESDHRDLKKQLAHLEKDLSYYLRVLNPIKNDKGLRLDHVSLEQQANSMNVHLNMVLTQLGRKNRTVIKGGIEITLRGTEYGQKKEYMLQELMGSEDERPLKFRFKYFQEFNENFSLPNEFIPEQVHVIARSQGKKSMSVEAEEDWMTLIQRSEHFSSLSL